MYPARKEAENERRFDHLNEEQKVAVFSKHQNNIVIASAGTGKTSVLANRIFKLLTSEHRVLPGRILALTFGKKASLEVREKLLTVLEDRQSLAERVQIFTFHGLAYRILKTSGLKFKLITQDWQKEKLLLPILRKHSIEADLAGEILAQLGLIINKGIPLHQLTAKNEEELERLKVFEAYKSAKQKEKLLDFDDLLQLSLQIIATSSQLRSVLSDSFDHVLLDELQDLNKLQLSLLHYLVGVQTQCFAVGDPKQAIYSFRGSSNQILLHLQKQMKDAVTHQLTQNYRSTEAIITLANQLIGDTSLQAVKKGGAAPILISPVDETAEAKQIIRMIRQDKLPLKDQCILYRTSETAHTIVEQLVREKIPLNVSGNLNLVYHHSKVAPIISHFRLITDTATLQDLRQVLMTLYISPKLIEIEETKEEAISLAAALSSSKLDHHQQERILDLLELYDDIRELPPKEICHRIRQHGYEAYALKGYPLLSDHRQRVIERLDTFQDSLTEYKTLVGFLGFLGFLEQAVGTPSEEGLKLSTIHSAKGLEFRQVFLISAVEGILPHQRALEAQKGLFPELYPDERESLGEEQRLAYVAVTRARDKLLISAPRKLKDREVEVSRFIRDFFYTQKQGGEQS